MLYISWRERYVQMSRTKEKQAVLTADERRDLEYKTASREAQNGRNRRLIVDLFDNLR
jgi:hypothetical protein